MTERDESTEYRGETFRGTRTGDLPGDKPLEAEGPQESAQGPSTIQYCPTCKSALKTLPNGRSWCSQCHVAFRSRNASTAVAPLLILILLFVLFPLASGLYVGGELDHSLAGQGLNWNPCAYYEGVTHCGDEVSPGMSTSDGIRRKLANLFGP